MSEAQFRPAAQNLQGSSQVTPTCADRKSAWLLPEPRALTSFVRARNHDDRKYRSRGPSRGCRTYSLEIVIPVIAETLIDQRLKFRIYEGSTS